jgi:hypothetical protein
MPGTQLHSCSPSPVWRGRPLGRRARTHTAVMAPWQQPCHAHSPLPHCPISWSTRDPMIASSCGKLARMRYACPPPTQAPLACGSSPAIPCTHANTPLHQQQWMSMALLLRYICRACTETAVTSVGNYCILKAAVCTAWTGNAECIACVSQSQKDMIGH